MTKTGNIMQEDLATPPVFPLGVGGAFRNKESLTESCNWSRNGETMVKENRETGCSKSRKEQRVLKDVLTYCKIKGGARGRAARQLAGEVDANRERPDITIKLSRRDAIAGIEHFRIDHHVKGGKKAESKSAELTNALEKQRQEIMQMPEGPDRDNAMVGAIGSNLAKAVQNAYDAAPGSLLSSLRQRLLDKERGHLEKLEDYRENVAKIDDARKLEMGFLIEVHSDFRGLYLNNNGKSCQLKQGECPLPSDLYEMLKETSVNIDWLLLGFYPSLSDTLVDAAVVNCRHGMFTESCKRQGVVKAEYLQLDSNEKSKRFEFTGYEQASESSDFLRMAFERIGAPIDFGVLMAQSFEKTAIALNLNQKSKVFVATLPIQALYETILPASKKHKGPFSAAMVWNMMRDMPYQERIARFDAFEKKYGVNGKSQQ